MSIKCSGPKLASISLITLGLAACSEAPSYQAQLSAPCVAKPDETVRFVQVPAGRFIKGKDAVYPEERPAMTLQVAAFEIQMHEVTNAQFAAFVDATGYVTDAEQSARDNRADAGSAVFQVSIDPTNPGGAWRLDASANWRAPEGETSSIDWRLDHPVVHVSQQDAAAYAAWAGGRLPSEVEWEYAATLGLPDPETATSGAYQGDTPIANTWQGVFPVADLALDGHSRTSPAKCFDADQLGLHDMIGNVWEWTDTPYAEGTHTIKGGSYLCADNFCRRYRPAARQPQETQFSSNHIGFRIVRDVPAADE